MKKIFLAMIVFLAWPFGTAQERNWNSQIQQLSFLTSQEIQDYKLGPGDLIEVSVYGVEDLSSTVRISSSGRISLPFIGKLYVAGMTGAELEDKLTLLMADAKLIREPQISVFVREYHSQPVYVMGAVNRPGQYMITQQLRLIDVIAMAGGIDLNRADDFAYFQRRQAPPRSDEEEDDAVEGLVQEGSGPPAAANVRIDLTDLLENGNMTLNVPVQGGDVIHVPERDIRYYYVIGEVGRPGAYELVPDQEVLVSQALAWAGGPGKTAKSNDGLLVRYDQLGGRQQLAVDFKDILSGKKPDFTVEADDVIFIPGSNIKTIGYGLLGVLPGTASNMAVYGARSVGRVRPVP